MGTAFKIDPSRFTPIDEAQPSTSPAAFPIDPTRFTPIDEVQGGVAKPEPFKIDPSRFTPIEDGDAGSPSYFSNAIDQAIAETPYIRQPYRAAASAIDSLKALGYRGKAIFHSATDSPAYADEANAQADAILAERERRNTAFEKTSGPVANIAAGAMESIFSMAAPGMLGGPGAAIATASATEGNEAYMGGRKAGLKSGDLAKYVASQMVAEAVPATMSQVAGVGGVEKRISEISKPIERGIKAAFARYGKSLKEELPEELTTTYIEQINAAQAGAGDASPEALEKGAFDTMATVLMTSGLAEVPSLLASPREDKKTPPAQQPSPTTPSPTPAPQATAAQPEPQYEQTYEQEFGDVWADLAQETPQAQPAPTPSPAEEVAPQATVAPTATTSETPEQFAERIDGAGQMEEADFTYYRENQAAVDEALRQMYDQPAEVDAVDTTTAPQPAEMPVVQSELERTKAELDSLERRKAEIDAKNTDDVYLDRFRGIMRPEVALEKAKREVLDDEDPEYTKQERDYTIADLEYMAFVDRAIQKATGDIKRSRFTDPVSDLYDMMGIMQPGGDMLLRLGVGRMRQHEGRATFNIESEATLRRLAQQIYKAQAESEGLDPDGLLGAYSGLTDSGKKIRADEAMEKAKYVIESIKNSLDLYASPPSTTQRAIAAPQPTESEVISNEEKGQKAEVLTEPQAVSTPEPPAPQQPEATPEYAPEPALTLPPTVTPEPAPEATPQSVNAPIRFKRSGKGDTAVHEASIEGRAVSISKGKDGWEVRLDGQVADVHPTMKAARDYAIGELRQDLVDQRNADEEEALAGQAEKQPWEMTNNEFDQWARPLIGLKSDAPISKEATAFILANKGMGLENLSPQGVRKWARENGKQVPDFRPESTNASNEEIDAHLLSNGYSSFLRIASDLGFRLDDSDKQTEVIRRALALEDEGRLERKDVSGGAFEWRLANPTIGPAPADTGIYRDLTAAAREGKRFVEALYPRIQPVLARIHAEAKSAVDFVRRAVSKIGEHIKPYAQRFLADVRAVNKEFRQNPTRGSVPTPEMPKRGKVTGEARGAGAPKLPQGMAPDAQTRQAGVVQGYKEGVLRQQQDTRAMLDIARQVLPAKEWRAIAKAAMSISRMRNSTEAGKRRALDRVLNKHLKDITHAKAVSQTVKALSKVKASMPKMEPSLKSAADQLVNSFSVRTPTASTLQKAEEVLLDAASGETSRTRSPKAVKAAKSLINSFLDGRTLSDMETEEVVAIRDLMNRINQLHEGGLKIVKDRLNADKVRVAKTAQEIQDNSTTQYPEEDFKGGSKIRAAKDETKNTLNLALELGPPDSEVIKTFYQNPTKGERQRNKVNFDAHQSILGVMESLGLVESGKFGSYKISDEALKMSPSMSGWMSRSRAGRWLGEKLGAVKPSIRSFKVEDGVIRLSDSERMFIYLLSRDGYAKSQLLKAGGNKIKIARNNSYHKMTPDLMDDVVASLSSNEKAIADAMFAYNNGPLREKINEFWRSMYGHDVFNETDHQSYRREMEGREPDGFGQSISNSYAENMSIIKQREGGTSPIIIDDAFAHWFAHVNKVATIIGQMKPTMDMRRALDNPDFKDAVVRGHKHGAQLLKELASRADFYGQISPKGIDPVQGFMRYFLRNTTGTAVATSPTANITAPMSVTSAQTVIPISHLLKSTGKTLDEAAFNEMKQWSPTMYFIITDTGHRIIDSETAGIGLQRFYGNQKTSASEKVTTLLRYMNDIAAFQIWRAAKSWGQSKGLTGDALMEFTAEKAEEAYSRSQPDNAWGMQSGLKLKARENIYHALRSVYQGQTQKAFNQALEAWNVYRWSDRSAAAKAQLSKDVVMPTIVQNLIYTMVFTATDYALASLKGDEEKKRKMREHPFMTASWNLIPSTIGIVPGSIGRVGSYLAMKMYEGLIGKPKGGGSISDPLLRNAEAAADAVYQAGRQLGNFTDGKRTDFTKLRKGILYILQTFSIPGRTIEDILEMVEANFK